MTNQIDYFEFQKDLERFNLIHQFKEFTELLKGWENDIFYNPFDIPEIYNKIIAPLKTYPTNLQPVLLKHLLEFRKTSNRSGSGAWEYLERYYSEMGKTQNQEPPPATDQEPPKAKPQKPIPYLPEIFKSNDYFDMVIKHLENDEFIELNRITGRFKWLKSKAFLAGLAFVLEKNNRLQNLEKYPNFKINTDKKQDLGRVFCNYFENVTFNEIQERAFQNSSITGTHRKTYFWIKEV